MTDIVIAAAPADEARAGAIAEVLSALGFDVAPRALDDADLVKAAEETKCVLALWSPASSAEPWLAAQAVLAMERKKLVCAELDGGALPASFEAAPRTNLDARDRIVFKQRFEALIAQIEKLTPTEGDADALPEALAKARAVLGTLAQGALLQGALAQGALAQQALAQGALTQGALAQGAVAQGAVAQGALAQGAVAQGALALEALAQTIVAADAPLSPFATAEPLPPTSTQAPKPPVVRRRQQWWRIAGLATMTLFLFAIGIGASRLITALRTAPLLVPRIASAAPPAMTGAPGYGLTEAQLETLPWREAAARINAAESDRIKAAAEHGDAFAQTLACLAHLAGTAGFLPSPTAASGFCDQASAQNYRAGLYLSWTLRRTAPSAPISEAMARDRLAEAARRGLVAAQIDYALVVAPDGRAPVASQVEAGRLLLGAAEHGDPRGQYYYARWLRDSPAGPRDPAAAIPYLQHASDAGERDALHMLGTLYRDGVGVSRDPARAEALYERAAAQNFAPSMMNLADMLRGEDHDRAAALYGRLACMRDEHQIAPLAARRLHAMGQSARCT